MTQPRPPRPGRKRPDVAQDLGIPDGPPELDEGDVADQHLGDLDADQHHDTQLDGMDVEPSLVLEGDIITASATLAVAEGDGKTSYFGYKHTTRVMPEEGHLDVYSRAVTVVNEGVIGLIDDNRDRWLQYEQELERRYQAAQQRAARQQGGQQ